jgi:hypothetical protein
MEITASHNTFVQMFNLELNKKNIHDVEMTKDNYKHVLANENKKTKTLQEELKRVDLENKDLKRQIQVVVCCLQWPIILYHELKRIQFVPN